MTDAAHVDAGGAVLICPKCGVPLVVRTAQRGERKGERCYGCPNYPKRREMRAYERAPV